MYLTLRRRPLLGLLALLCLLAPGTAARAAGAPYPASQFITALAFDWNSFARHGQGSDNWPLTWSSDGHLYASWGDGGGLGPDAVNRAYVSIGIARFTGSTAQTIQGINQIGGLTPTVAQCMQLIPPDKVERYPGRVCFQKGRHGKSWGILARGDQLYLWVSPASAPKFLYTEARLYRATRGTNQWTRADWAFLPSDPVRIIEPTFLQAGQDHADLDHLYVYAPRYAPVTLTDLAIQKSAQGGQIMLMRLPRSADPMRRESYEYFAGLTAAGTPIWSRDRAQMKPALTDANGVGWTVSATYVKELGRYFVITEHTRSKRSLMGIFEAKDAWGPWRTVFYGTLSNKAKVVPAKAFFANIVPNSIRDGGRGLTLAFTGVDEVDALNLVDVRLTLNEAFR